MLCFAVEATPTMRTVYTFPVSLLAYATMSRMQKPPFLSGLSLKSAPFTLNRQEFNYLGQLQSLAETCITRYFNAICLHAVHFIFQYHSEGKGFFFISWHGLPDFIHFSRLSSAIKSSSMLNPGREKRKDSAVTEREGRATSSWPPNSNNNRGDKKDLLLTLAHISLGGENETVALLSLPCGKIKPLYAQKKCKVFFSW